MNKKRKPVAKKHNDCIESKVAQGTRKLAEAYIALVNVEKKLARSYKERVCARTKQDNDTTRTLQERYSERMSKAFNDAEAFILEEVEFQTASNVISIANDEDDEDK